jgi:trk system potassium uptake protein TrkH
MSLFDAICHSFSTLSTGGFSTRNGGLVSFSSPYIRAIITFFMFIAGTNMTIIYFAFKRNFRKITGNNEFILYLILCLVLSAVVSLLIFRETSLKGGSTIIDGTFHVVSFITTTGFYTQDFNLWGGTLIIITFILMFIGGMAGSTTGSIKVLRLLIVARNSRHEFRRLIHPDAVIPVRLDKKSVSGGIVYNLLIFTVLYFVVICAGALFISLMGYDLITSLSTSASMLGNIGPGIGEFGPFSNYADIPVAGKWFFSALMLLGRLELLAVITLFTRSFYKR